MPWFLVWLLSLVSLFFFGAVTPTHAEQQTGIEPPQFSHPSGFYAKEFTLQLSHPDPEVTIYYSLDGSEPDPDNLAGSTYRYKNSYQRPPSQEGETIAISQDFLYHEYITHQYKQPIAITNRVSEPDRISQISTTFGKHPTYFPKPTPAEHWSNGLIRQANRVIKEINRFGNRVNRLGNRAIRKYHKLSSGEVRPLGNRQFVVSIPTFQYKKYSYSFKGTPVRAIAVKENASERLSSPITTQTYFIGDSQEFSLPIIALTVPEKDLFSYDDGLFVAGKSYDQYIKTATKKEPSGKWNTNYKTKNSVLASLSVLDGGEVYDISLLPIKVHGGATRRHPQKSFRAYFDKGTPSQGLGGPAIW